jgi:hypothetical protein
MRRQRKCGEDGTRKEVRRRRYQEGRERRIVTVRKGYALYRGGNGVECRLECMNVMWLVGREVGRMG